MACCNGPNRTGDSYLISLGCTERRQLPPRPWAKLTTLEPPKPPGYPRAGDLPRRGIDGRFSVTRTRDPLPRSGGCPRLTNRPLPFVIFAKCCICNTLSPSHPVGQ